MKKTLLFFALAPLAIFTSCSSSSDQKEVTKTSSSSLNFKYNHNDLDPKIFILGKITKKTTNMNIFDLRMFKDKGLGTMYEGFNDVFTELFKLFDILNKNEYVISPIAVYFEDDIL